ncbi:S8 family serine peptidase, partial [Streptomyces sp. TRM76130]|nr:S8 family serine peptidase [Streptomyces sp. TRM76130]
MLLTTAPTASADDVRDAQWPLTVYDAEKVWETSEGAGVTVAVIDSGVDASHPDLTGQVLAGKDFTGAGDPHEDNDGHGTGMASLIAGHGHGAGNADGVMGLAPKAKILPVRVDTTENKVDTAAWAAGVRYAVDSGASVINLSLGDSNGYPGSKAAEAISYAQEHDVVVVAASGNDAGTVTYPAALPGVVAVSAVDQALRPWSKSNTGSVVVAAPGVATPQADPTIDSGYISANGTSGSAAYVSAIVALLRSEYPKLTAGQIINRLVKSASFLNNEGRIAPDEQLGYGIARPGTALTMDISAGPKEGPLAEATSDSASAVAGSEGDNSASESKESSSMGSVYLIAGIAVVVIFIAVVIAVVRNCRNRGSGGSGPNGGTPTYNTAYTSPTLTSYQSDIHPYTQRPPHRE